MVRSNAHGGASTTLVTVLFVLGLLSSVLSMPAMGTAAQEATPGPDTQVGLFAAPGVTSDVDARADVDLVAPAEPHLVLERLTLPAGSQFPERTAQAPELLFVEQGDITISDNFGFTSASGAGDDVSINTGASYTLANHGTVDASVLRLSLTAPQAEQTPVPTIESATPAVTMATPVDLTSAAQPTAETLIDQPLDNAPLRQRLALHRPRHILARQRER